ncbi:MAG: heme ABC transporter ATP-binding protein [Candidatus Cloacimonadota bacterium]|nr:MAG: heme ABC transporter ATP-binding protein [Candidatus Cloacimonadota bacterium]
MPNLQLKDIFKEFPGVIANDNVSLTVEKGEIHALLGENGAGKTTLMNILYGIYTKDVGTIIWKDEEVSFKSPRDAIESGIGMVHQHFMLVPTLSVAQNITLGIKDKGYPFNNRKKVVKDITELSKKYGLQVDPTQLISKLSVGARQRVEILKSLYRNAELLILDEPTAVLTPQETDNFFEILKKLKKEGHSVIIITHRIPEVIKITDKVTILKDGKNVATVKTSETNENELSNYMIGRSLKTFSSREEVIESEDNGLVLEHVGLNKKLKTLTDISFQVKKGEIFGIAGVDGNGQKELAEVIAGIRKPDSGTILIAGKNMNRASFKTRKKAGLAYITDDRHHEGLVLDMNVTENMILKDYDQEPFSKKSIINYNVVREKTEQRIKDYDIKTPGVKTPIRLLSGGNQQKVIIARELAVGPSVVLACQPTRGLDIGATEFVRQILINKRNEGLSILLISADLEEIVSICDRIAVIFEGRIVGIVKNGADLDLNKIGLMMAGHIGETVNS